MNVTPPKKIVLELWPKQISDLRAGVLTNEVSRKAEAAWYRTLVSRAELISMGADPKAARKLANPDEMSRNRGYKAQLFDLSRRDVRSLLKPAGHPKKVGQS
jgi:hypothetical protein